MENKKKTILIIDQGKFQTLKLVLEKYVLENPDEFFIQHFPSHNETMAFLKNQNELVPKMIFSHLGEYSAEQSISGLENLQKEYPAVPIFLVTSAAPEIVEEAQKKVKIAHRFYSPPHLDDLKEKVKSYLW